MSVNPVDLVSSFSVTPHDKFYSGLGVQSL